MRFFSAVAALALVVGMPTIVSAACPDVNQQSCSSSYGVSETFFGTGGQLCIPGSSGYSTNYCAKSSVGELGVGNSLGTLYQTQAGFNTNREPSLAVLVNDSGCYGLSGHGGTAGTSFDAGALSTSAEHHVTANFSVLSYLASGYTVQTSGAAPTYAGGPHTLDTFTGFSSSPGTEQFGMNLVANTIDGGFGFDVAQEPDTTFGFGQPSTNYDTPDTFSYTDGAQIASSSKSSGVTCYFPSYIFNISNVTPAGTYVFNQSIVVTSTF